jgi:hypothetical protein
MWEFLGNIASTYGFGALIALIALGGMGYAVRALWKRNQELTNGTAGKQLKAIEDQLKELVRLETELHDVHLGPEAHDEQNRIKWYGAARVDELVVKIEGIIAEVRQSHVAKVESIREEHGVTVDVLRREFAERLTALQTARQNETAAHARRIDELQEKRLAEMKEVVTTVVRSSTETNAAVGKISTTMDTLTEVMTRR